MNDLSTRVRDYLDRKKPARQVEMTDDVILESVPEVKTISMTKFILTIISGLIGGLVLLWVMAVVEIQNDCYMSKECREWVEKNR